MRIRAGHIILLFLVILTGTVLFLTSRVGRDVEPEAFKEGLVPPMQDSMDDAPKIELETLELNLGVIPNDRETQTAVRVYNHGGTPLEIKDVISSCSLCTAGYFNAGDRQIPPGQSVEMQVVVKPAGIPGFHTVKTLSLVTNDPRDTLVQIKVEATIDPEFVLVPEEFEFGDVAQGTSVEAIVVLKTRGEKPVHVLNAAVNATEEGPDILRKLQLSVEAVPESDWESAGKPEYRIRATLAPDMPLGNFLIPVFIHTDLERFSPHMVFSRGVVVRAASNTPGSTDVSPTQDDQRPEGNP